MSSPSIGIFSMSHIRSPGGARDSKGTLGVGNRRGSTSSDTGMTRRGSSDCDAGGRRSSGGEEHVGEGGGDFRAGEGKRTGVVHFDEEKNSVFTSSSYAASRGLQRTSPSRPISGIDLTHPVAPPRAKGMATTAASILSSLTSVGVKKSCSEVIVPTPIAAPAKGILKSSSGIFKINPTGVPISKSPSGGNLSTSSRVNFRDFVNDTKNVASSPPSSSEPPTGMSVKSLNSSTIATSFSKVAAFQVGPDNRKSAMKVATAAHVTASTVANTSQYTVSSSHSTYSSSSSTVIVGISSGLPASKPPDSQPSPPPVAPPRTRSQNTTSSGRGPTGRTLTRATDEVIPPQESSSRKKADSSPHPIHYPKAQYPQQKETQPKPSQPKATQHSQPKESLPQLQQQKGTQHPQRRDSDKTLPLQQQVKLLQRRDSDINEKKLNSQAGEIGAQESLKLKQQQRDAEKQELLRQQQQQQQQSKQKQQQKTPKIEIPDAKRRIEEEYQREQQFQQLIRAGSLGSGEPAAILQQRSRSPLPSAGRQGFDSKDKQVIPPIVVAANTSQKLDRKAAFFQTQDSTETKTNAERTKASDLVNNNIAGRKPEVIDNASKGTGPNAAVETRTGVIRAAAKAYTENFQAHSYSSYLTQTRKDSVPSKETPVTNKESQENSTEIKSQLTNSTQQSPSSVSSNATTTQATNYNTTPRPFSRSTAGKIIVPLDTFTLSSINKGDISADEINANKVTERIITVHQSNHTENPSGQLDPKPVISKSDNSGVKNQTGNLSNNNTQEPQNTIDRVPAKGALTSKEPVKIAREKAISSCNTSTPSSPPTSNATTVKNNLTNTPAPPPNRKINKTLPPILTSLKFATGDRMKGNSEGALLVACRVAEEDQVIRLLKELTATGALDATALNQADRSGRTSLSYACANAFLRIVESLTSMSGIDINKSDTDGNTPLHFAAQAGHTEIVSHLVNKCNRTVDLDARNALGFTPLMKAALQGRTKIAKILLFAGASPHLRDFGRGLCAVEWARYTGRHICSELIDSVQKSCSSHIRDRWTSDPDLKSHSSTSINTLGQGDNKESWIKHKIKKAFHKSESKKEFSVVTNLSTMAVCATSPLLPTAVTQQDMKPHQVVVPHVQITEVKVPDCYEDPEDALSRLPPPPPPPVLPPEEAGGSSPKSPNKQSKNSTANTAATSSSASTTSTASTTTPSSSSASAPASSAPASVCSTSPTAGTEPSPSSPEEITDGTEMGDAKSNGTAKSIVSSSKLPFSSTKKRK